MAKKKKYLKSIVIIILSLLGIMLIWLSLTSSNYTLIRQTEIDVPPRFAYQYLNDLKNRNGWSIWEKGFSDQKFVFSSPSSGVGANYYWADLEGEKNGEITITHNKEDKEVRLKFNDYYGFDSEMDIEWEINPIGTKSLCVIQIQSNTSFLGRLRKNAISKNISEEIENSFIVLADSMKAAYLAGMPKIREGFYGFKNVLSITKTVSKKRIASREFVWPAIDEIKNYIDSMGFEQVGAPFTIFHNSYGENQTVEVGIPTKGELIGKGEIVPTLMMGEIIFIEVNGSYNQLDDIRYYLENHIFSNNIKVCCDPFEEYIVMPSDYTRTADLRTRICIPK